jgi:hypothetical protein
MLFVLIRSTGVFDMQSCVRHHQRVLCIRIDLCFGADVSLSHDAVKLTVSYVECQPEAAVIVQ